MRCISRVHVRLAAGLCIAGIAEEFLIPPGPVKHVQNLPKSEATLASVSRGDEPGCILPQFCRAQLSSMQGVRVTGDVHFGTW